jgi:hypothetical protein
MAYNKAEKANLNPKSWGMVGKMNNMLKIFSCSKKGRSI